MAKFSLTIPDLQNDIVGQVMINQTDNKRAPALEYLLYLARMKPKHTAKDFGPQADNKCNLTMNPEEYKKFDDFRSKNRPALSKHIQFFEVALRLGCSLYDDGYRLSLPPNRDMSQATLLLPLDSDPSDAPAVTMAEDKEATRSPKASA